MGRMRSRAAAVTREQVLTPQREQCSACGRRLWVAYHEHRRVVCLDGVWGLTLRVRRCPNQECAQYHRPYVPEEAGAWALPQTEFGLDVIALIGQLRAREQRSVPQLHTLLRGRGVDISERSVTDLAASLRGTGGAAAGRSARLRERLAGQGGVILAIDGLQPDVGHEVLWVLRDVVSGELLLARSLLGATADDLAPLLEEVRVTLGGELGGEPGGRAGWGADRHPGGHLRWPAFDPPGGRARRCQACRTNSASSTICAKRPGRSSRPIAMPRRSSRSGSAGCARLSAAWRGRSGAAGGGDAQLLPGRAQRPDRRRPSAAGRPPLAASGLKLRERLEAISESLDRVEQARAPEAKGG